MVLLLMVTAVLPMPTARAPPKLAVIGLPEVVWNATRDGCPMPTDSVEPEKPDSMPLAWHDPATNLTKLLIGSTYRGTYPSIGRSLHSISGLKHDCATPVWPPVNLSAPKTYDPSSYLNYEWVQSVRTYPNGSTVALVHNEMHGELSGVVSNATRLAPPDPALCSHRPNKSLEKTCVFWSTVLGTSDTAGATWTRHTGILFTLPRKYIKDAKIAGYGALGAIQYADTADGQRYWYGHVYRDFWDGTGAGPPSPSGSGNPANHTLGVCVWRTTDLWDPSAYRGWNGSAWSSIWADPYTQSIGKDLSRYTCASINTGGDGSSHPSPRRFSPALHAAGWPSHTLFGWPAGPSGGHAVSYSFPAWQSGDAPYTNWTTSSFVNLTGWFDPELFGPQRTAFMRYPTLLDSDSPFSLARDAARDDPDAVADALSYNLIGNSSLYIYFNWVGEPLDLLVRVPVAWLDPGAPEPQPPFGPPPPQRYLPASCTKLVVSGAGMVQVNGVYARDPSTPSIVFSKDANHQVYCLVTTDGAPRTCVWHMAHMDHPPVFYKTTLPVRVSGNNSAPIPENGWLGGPGTSGALPYPTVSCAFPAA
eukprot:m.124750 g.124750  ORF g.124750 m.124750 type:complete len:588 (-) comp13511_c0_seq1:2585-4348(-)